MAEKDSIGLNFKEIELNVSIENQKFLLELCFYSADKLSEFINLFSIFLEDTPKSELRVDLPKGWTLYFSVINTDSKLLVSHPSSNEWISTIKINTTGYSNLFSLLKEVQSDNSKSIIFSQLSRKNPISNLELVLKLN